VDAADEDSVPGKLPRGAAKAGQPALPPVPCQPEYLPGYKAAKISPNLEIGPMCPFGHMPAYHVNKKKVKKSSWHDS